MRCERESGSGVVGSSPERAGKRRGDGSGLSDTFASRKFPQATGELLALLRDSGLALETKEETTKKCFRYVRDSKILDCETFHN